MSKRALRYNLAAIFLITSWAFAVGAPVRFQSNQACILFYGGDRSIRVEFSDSDLRRVEADWRYVQAKMDNAGARCRGNARRISECIWVCPDGQRTSTCHETLKQALKLLWGDYK